VTPFHVQLLEQNQYIESSSIPLELVSQFRDSVRGYYKLSGRLFPWRETRDPYHIIVSEFMLQQTQVERVRAKYGRFIHEIPDFETLARSDLRTILWLWQGLGYNRRAIALKEIAVRVIRDHAGELPSTVDELIQLPGIGNATAGSILAFAFNKPAVFIETNIRRVFIHEFFQDRTDIKDKEIMPFVEVTLDHENPRHWYYALMDYGAMLKKQGTNPNRKSAHYTIQKPFEDSDRQVRGTIIKLLLAKGTITVKNLVGLLGFPQSRVEKILTRLEKEEFIVRSGSEINIK
jgi:A/G-specific adenine glycosylase